MRNAILQWKMCLAPVVKQNGGPNLQFSANQLTANYCDILVWPAYKRRHEWRTACKHCFMTCNTISFVPWLIRMCFRRNLLDLLGGVCSMNIWLSLYLFWLLCCITPCESSGRFNALPGIYVVLVSSANGSSETVSCSKINTESIKRTGRIRSSHVSRKTNSIACISSPARRRCDHSCGSCRAGSDCATDLIT